MKNVDKRKKTDQTGVQTHKRVFHNFFQQTEQIVRNRKDSSVLGIIRHNVHDSSHPSKIIIKQLNDIKSRKTTNNLLTPTVGVLTIRRGNETPEIRYMIVTHLGID